MNKEFYDSLKELEKNGYKLSEKDKDYIARYEYFNADVLTDIDENGRSKSKEKLFDIALPYIESQARKYPQIYDDIKQEASMDVWAYIQEGRLKYEYAENTRFLTVVVPIVRNAIQKIFSMQSSYNLDPTSFKKMLKVKKMKEENISDDEICKILKISQQRLFALLNFSKPSSLETIISKDGEKVITLEEMIADDNNTEYNLYLEDLERFLSEVFSSKEEASFYLKYNGINKTNIKPRYDNNIRMKLKSLTLKLQRLNAEKQKILRDYLITLSSLKQ